LVIVKYDKIGKFRLLSCIKDGFHLAAPGMSAAVVQVSVPTLKTSTVLEAVCMSAVFMLNKERKKERKVLEAASAHPPMAMISCAPVVAFATRAHLSEARGVGMSGMDFQIPLEFGIVYIDYAERSCSGVRIDVMANYLIKKI
jgi:hypothetical protein